MPDPLIARSKVLISTFWPLPMAVPAPPRRPSTLYLTSSPSFITTRFAPRRLSWCFFALLSHSPGRCSGCARPRTGTTPESAHGQSTTVLTACRPRFALLVIVSPALLFFLWIIRCRSSSRSTTRRSLRSSFPSISLWQLRHVPVRRTSSRPMYNTGSSRDLATRLRRCWSAYRGYGHRARMRAHNRRSVILSPRITPGAVSIDCRLFLFSNGSVCSSRCGAVHHPAGVTGAIVTWILIWLFRDDADGSLKNPLLSTAPTAGRFFVRSGCRSHARHRVAFILAVIFSLE